MMRRWGRLVFVSLTSALLLSGCDWFGAKKATAPSESSTQKMLAPSVDDAAQDEEDTDDADATDEAPQTTWDADKTAALQTYMTQFEQAMGQPYVHYDGVTPLDVIGFTMPDDLAKERVNGQITTLGWAPDGQGDNAYNVVGIYHYEQSAAILNRITYFFAFHDGAPIVLCDQSNNGEPSASESKNQSLNQAFRDIAAGREPASIANETPAEIRDLRLIGIMVHQLVFNEPGGDDIMPALRVYWNEDRLYVGSGTSLSTCGFRRSYDQEEDGIDYYVKDASTGLPTSEQPYIEHHTTVRALTAKFAATPAQRAATGGGEADATSPVLAHHQERTQSVWPAPVLFVHSRNLFRQRHQIIANSSHLLP